MVKKIQCPLTGKQYNVLSKQGQNIILNYKRYNQMQMGGSFLSKPTNTMKDVITYDEPYSTISQSNLSNKTLQTLAIINGQETIKKIIDMVEAFNIDDPFTTHIPLINFYILLHIDHSSNLLQLTCDFIRTPNNLTMGAIKEYFNNNNHRNRVKIIKLFKLDGFSEYILYRVFTYEHYILSIIQELDLYKIPAMQELPKKLTRNIIHDIQLFKLEVVMIQKAKCEKEKALKNIMDSIKKNKLPIRLTQSYETNIQTLKEFRKQNLRSLYADQTIGIHKVIDTLHILYYYLLGILKLHNGSLQSPQSWEYNDHDFTRVKEYINEKILCQSRTQYSSQLGGSGSLNSLTETDVAAAAVAVAAAATSASVDVIARSSHISHLTNYSKTTVMQLFLLVINEIKKYKRHVIATIKDSASSEIYTYALEHNIFTLMIIEDNYNRFGLQYSEEENPASLEAKNIHLHDKCMEDLDKLFDMRTFVNRELTEDKLIQLRLNIEDNKKVEVTFDGGISDSKLGTLSEKIQSSITSMTLYKDVTINAEKYKISETMGAQKFAWQDESTRVVARSSTLPSEKINSGVFKIKLQLHTFLLELDSLFPAAARVPPATGLHSPPSAAGPGPAIELAAPAVALEAAALEAEAIKAAALDYGQVAESSSTSSLTSKQKEVNIIEHIKRRFSELTYILYNFPNVKIRIPGVSVESDPYSEGKRSSGFATSEVDNHRKNVMGYMYDDLTEIATRKMTTTMTKPAGLLNSFAINDIGQNYYIGAHGHYLGVGLAFTQWPRSAERREHYKAVLEVIDTGVNTLYTTFTDRVLFGQISSDIADDDTIIVWGANVNNWNDENLVKRPRGDGQASFITEQKWGVFGIVTTPYNLTSDNTKYLHARDKTHYASLPIKPRSQTGGDLYTYLTYKNIHWAENSCWVSCAFQALLTLPQVRRKLDELVGENEYISCDGVEQKDMLKGLQSLYAQFKKKDNELIGYDPQAFRCFVQGTDSSGDPNDVFDTLQFSELGYSLYGDLGKFGIEDIITRIGESTEIPDPVNEIYSSLGVEVKYQEEINTGIKKMKKMNPNTLTTDLIKEFTAFKTDWGRANKIVFINNAEETSTLQDAGWTINWADGALATIQAPGTNVSEVDNTGNLVARDATQNPRVPVWPLFRLFYTRNPANNSWVERMSGRMTAAVGLNMGRLLNETTLGTGHIIRLQALANSTAGHRVINLPSNNKYVLNIIKKIETDSKTSETSDPTSYKKKCTAIIVYEGLTNIEGPHAGTGLAHWVIYVRDHTDTKTRQDTDAWNTDTWTKISDLHHSNDNSGISKPLYFDESTVDSSHYIMYACFKDYANTPVAPPP